MAAVVNVDAFLARVKPFRRLREEPTTTEHGSWRLPANHIADLQDIARGVEETDVGMCCTYLVDQLTSGADFDETALEAVESFCDENNIWSNDNVHKWRSRIKRARNALSMMHHEGWHNEVAILHITYGYVDPVTREYPQKMRDMFGDLASLAKYTDLVEVRRQELARTEAIDMSRRTPYVPTPDKKVPELFPPSETVEQHGDEQTRAAIKQGLPAQAAGFMVDLVRHRELHQRALRIVSSGDAMRSLLAPCSDQGPEEVEAAYQFRKNGHADYQSSMLSMMKIEASKMLERSSRNFYACWLQVTA